MSQLMDLTITLKQGIGSMTSVCWANKTLNSRVVFSHSHLV